ncbi:DUF58 domain-containing protein [Carboxydochorda subterranea]|uniref:DUF58 domain-containing protein n=1 Tax=Carboxydichorda subterranea TaxID=3109565 RepID=A0ABZ1BVB2_9FIRM|nr:DUF58 domain-containing protein [Limnochorda sp. L945t]WRP16712.1 DUF58 domain-containing protein [Limnochorda sp. L945t]
MLDERWLGVLGQLRFATELRPKGTRPAWRPVSRPGSGLEFLSHREYMPGDDFRAIDWKALARFDRPFVRTHAREEGLPVELLLDTSASMSQAQPSKLAFAAGLAACLGYVALASGEPLRLALPGPGGIRSLAFDGLAGVTLRRLVRALGSLAGDGATELDRWTAALTRRHAGPALTLVISDLLQPPAEVEKALRLLEHGRRAFVLLHVLSPEEHAPAEIGELRLVDVETQESAWVRVDPLAVSRYVRALRAWQAGLRRAAEDRGGRYASLRSDLSPFETVVRTLREAGVVR